MNFSKPPGFSPFRKGARKIPVPVLKVVQNAGKSVSNDLERVHQARLKVISSRVPKAARDQMLKKIDAVQEKITKSVPIPETETQNPENKAPESNRQSTRTEAGKPLYLKLVIGIAVVFVFILVLKQINK